MTYEQYPYYLFNQSLFSSYNAQQIREQNQYWEQQKKIGDMVNAISDYFKAARDISPEFEQQAMGACFAEIMRQMEIDRSAQR